MPDDSRASASTALVPVANTPGTLTLTIARKTVRFTGDPQDPYFQNLGGFLHDLPHIEAFVRKHLPGDAICLDVGANIGLTAILLSLLCPDGHVYAFEALPKNQELLRTNLRLNGIGNCTVIASAVGADAGRLDFKDSGAGSHVVTDAHLDRGNRATTSVPVATLDAIVLDELRLPRVDFVKMDVEGFEPPALAGGARLIERFRPPIFMEFNAWSLAFAHGFSPFAFAEALFRAFECFNVEATGELRPLEAMGAAGFAYNNMVVQNCVSDVLLRPRPGIPLPTLQDMTEYAGQAAWRERAVAAIAERDAIRRGATLSEEVARTLRTDLDAAERNVATAEERSRSLEAMLEAAQREAAAARDEAGRLDAEINTLRSSATWRLLEPYRRLRQHLRP